VRGWRASKSYKECASLEQMQRDEKKSADAMTSMRLMFVLERKRKEEEERRGSEREKQM